MRLNPLKNKKGFTLIELMIVVVIIGILAALAIPRFMTASTRSKQAECKQMLKQIYTMQHTFRQGNPLNAYGETTGEASTPGVQYAFTDIGVEVGSNAIYTYTMTAVGANTFTATATANLDDDAAIDTWSISETGVLVPVVNDATT